MLPGKFLGALTPIAESQKRFAFCSSFGIKGMSANEEYGLSVGPNGRHLGCRVPRVNLSIHCYEPHLETSCHVLHETSTTSFPTALPIGTVERCVLVTPRICAYEESNETYPIGKVGDFVLTAVAIRACIDGLHETKQFDSIIVRIPTEYLKMSPNSNEILSWPYLTIECAELINERFRHYRTNAPSIEPDNSQGGMWSHCIFFGVDEETRISVSTDSVKRTIGELFHIPPEFDDGEYSLMCPYIDMGLDCALTVPMLYALSI